MAFLTAGGARFLTIEETAKVGLFAATGVGVGAGEAAAVVLETGFLALLATDAGFFFGNKTAAFLAAGAAFLSGDFFRLTVVILFVDGEEDFLVAFGFEGANDESPPIAKEPDAPTPLVCRRAPDVTPRFKACRIWEFI